MSSVVVYVPSVLVRGSVRLQRAVECCVHLWRGLHRKEVVTDRSRFKGRPRRLLASPNFVIDPDTHATHKNPHSIPIL
jgi:hypothetical protein